MAIAVDKSRCTGCSYCVIGCPNDAISLENLHLVGYDCIGSGMAGDIIPHGVERALHTILGDAQYAPRDEKPAARFDAWLRARVLRLMALAQRFKK